MAELNNLRSIQDLRSIQELNLVWGNRCNMDCRHCINPPKVVDYPYVISDEVVDFISEWTKTTGRNTIFLWGREPLIYWEYMKPSILKLEQVNPKFKFILLSNGLLLTQDIVDFANSHRVLIQLSCDGPLPVRVRDPVPPEVYTLYRQLKRQVIHAVYYAVTPSLVGSWAWLRSAFPAASINFVPVVVTGDIPKELYDFKSGQIAENIRELYDYAIRSGDRDLTEMFKRVLKPFDRNAFFNYLFNDNVPTEACSITPEGYLTLDYSHCYNLSGHIRDGLGGYLKELKAFKRNAFCYSCAFCDCLGLCRIGLPTKPRNGYEYVQCGYMREYYRALKRCASN